MKRFFPGNWINSLGGYQGQPVIALPGRKYYHRMGYIKVDSTPRTEFDVIIPSPDKRPDDKPRPDIVGLKVPNGVYLYHVGLRVLGTRKDSDRSGLVWGAAPDRIKLASAVNVNGATITATTASTPPIDDTSLTVTPRSSVFGAGNPVLTTAEMTLKLYYDNGSTGAGAVGLSSLEPGGAYLVAETCYYTTDECSGPDDFGGLPALVESL